MNQNPVKPLVTPLVHNPAAATQATITQAAAGSGYKNVCTGLTVSIAAAGTAQTPIHAYLRDGATGAGAIKWSAVFSAPANSSQYISLDNLSIPGSDNTAMTLEFEGAGVAASVESVALQTVVMKV
jgi:hypothetical protein